MIWDYACGSAIFKHKVYGRQQFKCTWLNCWLNLWALNLPWFRLRYEHLIGYRGDRMTVGKWKLCWPNVQHLLSHTVRAIANKVSYWENAIALTEIERWSYLRVGLCDRPFPLHFSSSSYLQRKGDRPLPLKDRSPPTKSDRPIQRRKGWSLLVV